ncbi:hypothetical protein ACFC4G_27350 [Streptomyces sp. NPDC056002]|uniref:hypothetical protein n=1 Tax=Streptomyces sp. NPDC056002 TaxID=3345675 RepID=UPI0035D71D0A
MTDPASTPARPAAPAHPDGPARPDGERGCLRVVLALPFGVLTLIAAYFCWTAMSIRPSGSWDDDAYGGIVLSCVVTVAAAGSATALWLLPSVRRVVGWGWVAPALVLGVTAAVRWAVSD